MRRGVGVLREFGIRGVRCALGIRRGVAVLREFGIRCGVEIRGEFGTRRGVATLREFGIRRSAGVVDKLGIRELGAWRQFGAGWVGVRNGPEIRRKFAVQPSLPGFEPPQPVFRVKSFDGPRSRRY